MVSKNLKSEVTIENISSKIQEKIEFYVAKLDKKEPFSLQEIEDFTLSIIFDILNFNRPQDDRLPEWLKLDWKKGKALIFETAICSFVPLWQQKLTDNFLRTVTAIYDSNNIYVNKDLLTLITNIFFTLSLQMKNDELKHSVAERYLGYMSKQPQQIQDDYEKTITLAEHYREAVLRMRARLDQPSAKSGGVGLIEKKLEQGAEFLDGIIDNGMNIISKLDKLLELSKTDLKALLR